jgi:uncharacterized protein (DUF58 family)
VPDAAVNASERPGWRQKLEARWREGIRHKVTPLGAMMLALLFTSGILAFTTTQNVFFLLFSLLMTSILISSFINRLMLAGLQIRLDLPEHAMAGDPVACVLEIENSKSWLPSFALELVAPVGRRFAVPIVPASGSAKVPVEVVWARRGVPDPVIVELSTRFPFGFSVRRTRVAVRVNAALYPSIREQAGFREELEQVRKLAAMAGGVVDPEFNQLRPYREGDDWRMIAWGKSARGMDWLVKETKASGEGHIRLALHRGASNFERSVELAAFLVWELQFLGLRFEFDCNGAIHLVTARMEAYEILAWLAGVSPEDIPLEVERSSVHLIDCGGLSDKTLSRWTA